MTGLDEVFRAEWARVVACLVRAYRDVDLAEDAAAEAFAVAADRWAHEGVPDNPGAWLVTTARHRAVDRLRRERTLADKTRLLDRPDPVPAPEITEDATLPDDRLELLFLCTHPALGVEAQVALTLRAVGGLSGAEIARAFLVPDETMKRRLSRARTKIKISGIPFVLPPPATLPERVAAVLAVVYLIFNQGYGDGRVDLAAEAIRLGRLLVELVGDRAEPAGLLALMLLHDSRREARVRDGEIVVLADQDRGLWDLAHLAEGRAMLARARSLADPGPYLVQAEIAALQVESPIDWPAVATLYSHLVTLTGSPVVELNRAVAVAEVDGPRAALDLVDRLELPDYRYVHSTRAELLRRLDDPDGARVAYARALDLATTEPERRFLSGRLASLRPGVTG